MKNTIVIMLAGASLCAANLAYGQEGGGEVNATVSGEATTTTPPTPAAETSAGGPAAGKMGFGAAIVLSGVGGVEGTYHLNDKLMINAMLAFASFSPDMGDSTTAVGFTASGFYSLFGHAWADLYGGLRLGYMQGQASGAGGNEDASEVIIELPLRLEIKLHRRFSIHFETGIDIDLITLKPTGGDNVSLTHFGLGAGGNGVFGLANEGGSGIFATGGFTIYL